MKKILFMTLVATALVGCSSNDVQEPGANDGSLITLKSVTYSAGAETRAPFIGAIGATNTLTALVPSSTATAPGPGNYVASLHTNTGTMTFNSTIAATYNLPSLGTGNAAKAAFPSSTAPVYLFGVYPVENWTVNATNADYTFAGNNDVMAAKEVSVNRTAVVAGSYQTLAFKHLLTKLEVKLRTEASSMPEVGLVKSVKWVGNQLATIDLKNKVTFTPATEGVAFAAAAPAVTSLPFYGLTADAAGVKTYTDVAYANKSYELTLVSTLQAYAMVVPVNATTSEKNEYFIEVERTGKTDIIPFDLMNADGTPFTGSTAGHSFTVIVNYTKDEIKAVATVTEWIENGEYVSNVPAV